MELILQKGSAFFKHQTQGPKRPASATTGKSRSSSLAGKFIKFGHLPPARQALPHVFANDGGSLTMRNAGPSLAEKKSDGWQPRGRISSKGLSLSTAPFIGMEEEQTLSSNADCRGRPASCVSFAGGRWKGPHVDRCWGSLVGAACRSLASQSAPLAM